MACAVCRDAYKDMVCLHPPNLQVAFCLDLYGKQFAGTLLVYQLA